MVNTVAPIRITGSRTFNRVTADPAPSVSKIFARFVAPAINKYCKLS